VPRTCNPLRPFLPALIALAMGPLWAEASCGRHVHIKGDTPAACDDCDPPTPPACDGPACQSRQQTPPLAPVTHLPTVPSDAYIALPADIGTAAAGRTPPTDQPHPIRHASAPPKPPPRLP
jgi:hypothetical protein